MSNTGRALAIFAGAVFAGMVARKTLSNQMLEIVEDDPYITGAVVDEIRENSCISLDEVILYSSVANFNEGSIDALASYGVMAHRLEGLYFAVLVGAGLNVWRCWDLDRHMRLMRGVMGRV